MKRPILILDGNNLAHRCYHSMGRLSYKGQSVSVIYGLPNLVTSLVKRFDPKKVFLVWDGKKSKIRKELLPEYKSHRKDFNKNFDPDDFYRQRDIAMKLFYNLGVKQIWDREMEADDCIFMILKKFTKSKIIIASNDKDFHQCITKRVTVVNGKDILLTPKTLPKNFNYTPENCVDYLCLVGDSSDNIPGYRGIGEERGKAFFLEHSSIANFLNSNKTHNLIDKEKLAKLYALNRQLIDLSYYNEQHIPGDKKLPYFKGKRNNTIKLSKFKEICAKYGMVTLQKKQFTSIWEKL